MKIVPYSKAEPRQFEGEAVKGVTGRVVIGKADGAASFCMRVFEIAPHGFTPLHSHDWEHEIFFHSGKGEVFCKGEWIPVQAGYTAFIPGNEEHRIRNAGEEKLVFACLIPSGAPEL